MRAWCIGPTLRKSGRPHAAHNLRASPLALRRRSAGSSAISLSTARSIASGAERSSGSSRRGLEAGDEVGGGGEVEVGAAPVEVVERAEAMLLDRGDFLVAELGRAFAAEAQRAEAAVALVAPGAAGDLRHFGDRQAALAAAVELVQPGEGDMGDVHVEAHADGVGGDEIIDLAALEHRDLGVARGGLKRAHHHRRAALEAAQHLGQRVDLLARESDDRAARGQARQLGRAGVAQGRKARAADDLGLGQQLADQRAQRVASRGSASPRGRGRAACGR